MHPVGKIIRTLRHEHGWNQDDLAQKLNISIPAYSKIETGITDINLSRLNQIAELYKLTLIGLLTYGDNVEQNTNLARLNYLNDRLRKREEEIIALQNRLIVLFEELKQQPKKAHVKKAG